MLLIVDCKSRRFVYNLKSSRLACTWLGISQIFPDFEHFLMIGCKAGFTTSGAPVRKKCGAPIIWIPPPLPSPDTHSSRHRHFIEDPTCCNAHYYCSSAPHKIVSFIPWSLFQYFGLVTMLQKNGKKFLVLLWGPPFCRAPVRPNMLNMPKSASDWLNDVLCSTTGNFLKIPYSLIG